jgi:hypothetical protein
VEKDPHIDLSAIDDRILDGLDFCRKVYDFFDRIKSDPDGKIRLRLQSKIGTRFEDKRLVEELLPLAYYIQARYRVGRRIRVRWKSGSQPYDAVLLSDGSLVERDGSLREVFVEITTSVHRNDYLVRQRVNQSGGSFGPQGTYREGRQIVSRPHVADGFEIPKDLAALIVASLHNKSRKGYSPETVLVVNCVPPCGWMDENEWKNATEQVRIANLSIPFREVFLVDMLTSNTATLYGDRRSVTAI